MISFLVLSGLYAMLLLFFWPERLSLKAAPLTFSENFHQVKASLCIGLLLMMFHYMVTDWTFYQLGDTGRELFVLSNAEPLSVFVLYKGLMHLFVHFDLTHLLSNVAFLGLCSAYERRAGSGRYLQVLIVGALASVASVFFYQQPVMICGISGGVFALAAAYWTDRNEFTLFQWVGAVATVAVGLTALSWWTAEGNAPASQESVDYYGHALGALAGVLYCRFFPGQNSENRPEEHASPA